MAPGACSKNRCRVTRKRTPAAAIPARRRRVRAPGPPSCHASACSKACVQSRALRRTGLPSKRRRAPARSPARSRASARRTVGHSARNTACSCRSSRRRASSRAARPLASSHPSESRRSWQWTRKPQAPGHPAPQGASPSGPSAVRIPLGRGELHEHVGEGRRDRGEVALQVPLVLGRGGEVVLRHGVPGDHHRGPRVGALGLRPGQPGPRRGSTPGLVSRRS